MTERISTLSPSPFLDGPSEFLVRTVAELLRAEPHFKMVFGSSIDGYRRMDYSMRQLPAIRVYNNSYRKDHESWFETGELILDLIFPANLRREETQMVQDQVSAAVVQQFRRTPFFNAVSASVPGLNELGKTVDIDKSLGFEWGENRVPLTQMNLNFRIDLRQWDAYLEQTGRTKDDPFDVTLGDFKRLVTVIEGLRDDASTELTLGSDQKPGGI